MSLLDISNLSLSIGETPVLRDVSLRIGKGEIVALTGESGSGKSLTAFSVMRLLPQGSALSGAIRLGDTDLTAMDEPGLCALRGKDIGMVFQEPMTALNPVQTIGAQVSEPVRLHEGTTRAAARARAEDVLARVGLPPDRFPLSRYPHELSGGQRQRVVIAMAIVLRPRLLIADEPTTALDVTTQAQILDLLTGLTREDGMGLMMITHDLAVVAGMADRIAVMREGRIVEEAPTRDLLTGMQHPYTKALFAASAHRVALPPAPPPEPLLVAQNVTRSYTLRRTRLFAKPRVVEAVRDVSFTLNRGERLGLVGESGCGKSTLTRVLLGLDPAQAGRITLNGAPLRSGSAEAPVQNRMQVVFQDPFGSFNPRHTVGRLISEPFHALPDAPGGQARAQAIAAALSDVGLSPDDQHRYIHEFSGGQRQRIAIARALITRPDLVIFDEAVSALDVSVRVRILDLLADLCRSYGLTWLFISHDLSVVRSVTDRVLVMQAGKIVEEAPTETLFTAPRHPYTRKLLAAVPTLDLPLRESTERHV